MLLNQAHNMSRFREPTSSFCMSKTSNQNVLDAFHFFHYKAFPLHCLFLESLTKHNWWWPTPLLYYREREKESAKSCPTFVTPWTVACQTSLSMGFSRQEYWGGLPFPSPGELPGPGIEPRSPALQACYRVLRLNSLCLFPQFYCACLYFHCFKHWFKILQPQISFTDEGDIEIQI